MARTSTAGTRRAPGRRASDFTQATLDHLRDEVGNLCSLCERPTSGPSRQPNKRTNVGTGAHITAASVLGPRYDPTLTPKQRRSHENGIWCCRDCGKLVDDDASTYTVAVLQRLKADAIARALYRVTTGKSAPRAQDNAPSLADLWLRWEEELAQMVAFTIEARNRPYAARRLDGWDTPFWTARKRELQKHFGQCEWWVDATSLYKRWLDARRSFPAVARYVKPQLKHALQLDAASDKLSVAERQLSHLQRCLRVERELRAITDHVRQDAIRICEAAARSPSGTYFEFAKALGVPTDGIARRLAVAAWNFSLDALPLEQDAKAAELLRTGWLPSAEVMMIEDRGASPAYDRLRRLKLGDAVD